MLLLMLISSLARAGSICNDGWVSPSEGSGTCSYHGGVASLCGGIDDLGNGVYTVRPPCPKSSEQDRDWTSIMVKHREEMWQLALEQARVEISAGRESPDRFIERAREIMVENWGTPAEKLALASAKKQAEETARLMESLISRIGKDHIETWLRYVDDPGVCWTIDTDAIFFKTSMGSIITLRKGQKASFNNSPEALSAYQALVAKNRDRTPTDGEICQKE
jgi:hypothetical protein